ncbi:MAG: UDP-N-acetylglucosamine 2-epimerase [Parcubacteria group bacterium GW2011_GWA2_51_10]|nr:MAG: UDP-N-acetylglucosamine 2-epimerase [Parcubacteria group bacterium GW2011_GWA2_51_10]
MKKRICIVTGTRAEYGLLRTLMQAISNMKNVDLLVVAAGMHLSKEFGNTVNEIRRDGFRVNARVPMTTKSDTNVGMAQSVGKGIQGMVSAFGKLRPHVVVVLGDRIEALAASIASAYMNIPLAHIHGGDITKGGIDESARHAITKFANLHFAATKKSAERIRKLGEKKENIFIVGAPGLDEISSIKKAPRASILKKFGIETGRFLLVLQHPVSTSAKNAAKEMAETLEAVKRVGKPSIVVYPNSDAGGRRMIRIIHAYEKKLPLIRAYPSIRRDEFLALMSAAAVLVGNSSSGIIEGAALHLPVVNIGSRQSGRERAKNVIDAPHKRKEIEAAILKAMSPAFGKAVRRAKNLYGDGRAGERIAKTLERLTIDGSFVQKQIAY